MTPMSSPPSLLAVMGRGQLKRKLGTSLIPKRATKPPMCVGDRPRGLLKQWGNPYLNSCIKIS
jgi:hypothetical protein